MNPRTLAQVIHDDDSECGLFCGSAVFEGGARQEDFQGFDCADCGFHVELDEMACDSAKGHIDEQVLSAARSRLAEARP